MSNRGSRNFYNKLDRDRRDQTEEFGQTNLQPVPYHALNGAGGSSFSQCCTAEQKETSDSY
jgi:hypothetical protein